MDWIYKVHVNNPDKKSAKNKKKYHDPNALITIAITHVDCQALKEENEELRRENERLHRIQKGKHDD